MKPFLGLDITDDAQNGTANEAELIAGTTPADIVDKVNKSFKNAQKIADNTELPLILRILKYLCELVTIVSLGFVLMLFKAEGVAFSVIWQSAPWLYFALGLGVIGLIILLIVEKRKSESATAVKNFENELSEIEKASSMAYSYLGVPENAGNMDVIAFRYKVRDGEIVPKAVQLAPTPYLNCNMKVFRQDDSLYFASVERKYRLPLTSLKGIRKIDKRITVMSWNKEEDPDSEKYSKFMIASDGSGCIRYKPYFILDFEINGEEWGLWFPSYELPQLMHLTGLKYNSN